MSEFENYRKRNLRLKALERVLQAAKNLIVMGKSPLPTTFDKVQAITELEKAIEEVDKLPPPVKA